MVRKSAFYVSLLGLSLALPAVAGCTFHGEGKLGGQAESPPPAPAPTPAPTTAPAPTTPPPATEPPKTSGVIRSGDSIKLPGNIVFDTGKATLKEGSGSDVVLGQLKQFLDENPNITQLRIEGHTDNVGKQADNLKLSGDRALTIKTWLVEHGIAKERLLAVGFGDAKPIANNSTEDGRAQNRRTEFHIAMLSGKKYLGMDPKGGGTVFGE